MGIRTQVSFGLLIVLIISMISACKHEPPVNPNPGGGGTTDTGICFTRDILPVFISNCAKAGCHDAISAQDGYRFTDYASIVAKDFTPGNPDETKLYKAIMETDPDKRMPRPPSPALTTEQKELIRRWIAQGAQNTTNCTTPCDSNNFKYSAHIAPLMNKYCTGCHNSQSPSGGYALDNYNDVKAVALSGRLLGAIKHETGYSPMPKGGSKLTDCQVAQVQKWVANGAPND